MQVTLPHRWAPRPYQMPLWRYLEGGGKRAVGIWHRRSGKDDVALHWTAVAAHERPGNYWHLLPLMSQARRARLHQRIGEALEGLHATNRELHLAELARHFVEGAKGGGDVDKAVEYSKQAGARAIGLHAYAEAVEHYQRGLQVQER